MSIRYDQYRLDNSTTIPKFQGSTLGELSKVWEYKQGQYDTAVNMDLATGTAALGMQFHPNDRVEGEKLIEGIQNEIKDRASRPDRENQLREVTASAVRAKQEYQPYGQRYQQWGEYQNKINNMEGMSDANKEATLRHALINDRGLSTDRLGRKVGSFSGLNPIKDFNHQEAVDRYMKGADPRIQKRENPVYGTQYYMVVGDKEEILSAPQIEAIVRGGAAADPAYRQWQERRYELETMGQKVSTANLSPERQQQLLGFMEKYNKQIDTQNAKDKTNIPHITDPEQLVDMFSRRELNSQDEDAMIAYAVPKYFKYNIEHNINSLGRVPQPRDTGNGDSGDKKPAFDEAPIAVVGNMFPISPKEMTHEGRTETYEANKTSIKDLEARIKAGEKETDKTKIGELNRAKVQLRVLKDKQANYEMGQTAVSETASQQVFGMAAGDAMKAVTNSFLTLMKPELDRLKVAATQGSIAGRGGIVKTSPGNMNFMDKSSDARGMIEAKERSLEAFLSRGASVKSTPGQVAAAQAQLKSLREFRTKLEAYETTKEKLQKEARPTLQAVDIDLKPATAKGIEAVLTDRNIVGQVLDAQGNDLTEKFQAENSKYNITGVKTIATGNGYSIIKGQMKEGTGANAPIRDVQFIIPAENSTINARQAQDMDASIRYMDWQQRNGDPQYNPQLHAQTRLNRNSFVNDFRNQVDATPLNEVRPVRDYDGVEKILVKRSESGVSIYLNKIPGLAPQYIDDGEGGALLFSPQMAAEVVDKFMRMTPAEVKAETDALAADAKTKTKK